MTGAASSYDAGEEKDFASLTAKIIRFADFLKCRGFNVAPSAAQDAVCSLLQIDPFVQKDFFSSLRSNLAKNNGDWHRFADCFHEFWNGSIDAPPPAGTESPAAAPPVDQTAACETERLSAVRRPSAHAAPEQDGADDKIAYSSVPAIAKELVVCFAHADIPAAAKALKQMLAPFRLDKSRRLTATAKKAAIDFPLAMRRSLKYEGLPLELPCRVRKKKLKRMVFLIDVSGSMNRYAQMLLPFILSLRSMGAKAETFAFSTALANITPLVRRMQTAQLIDQIGRYVPDWSGGTRIGRCLQRFNREEGRRLLSRRTVVTILSDGWDLGEKELLGKEMLTLRRKAGRIIWLNPLAGDRDYQPLCQGMKAALPYIDYFLPAGSLNELCKAGHLIARLISV